MEALSDYESKEKIKRQLKKDQKKIEREIDKFRDEGGDLGVRTLDFQYIIDYYGEHRFDVRVECRKSIQFNPDTINSIKVIVKMHDEYNKEPIRTTCMVLSKYSIDSIYIIIYGIIMAQWDELV